MGGMLALGDLHADGDLAAARRLLLEAVPRDAAQARERDRIVAGSTPIPATRTCARTSPGT